MHAMVFRVTIEADREEAENVLREQLVPAMSQAPGFVAGYWVNVGGDQGRSMVVFESEEAAQRAAEQVGGPPEGVASVDSFETGEVVAHA